MVKRFENKELDEFVQKKFRMYFDEYEIETPYGYYEASEAEIAMYLMKSLALSLTWNYLNDSWFAQNSLIAKMTYNHGGDILLADGKTPEGAIFKLAEKIFSTKGE